MNGSKHPFLILLSVLIPTFFAVYSSIITPIADGLIQGELGLSEPLVRWLTTLYLLGINSVVPTASFFQERFGAKKMYLIGLVIYTLASMLAGFSENFLMIGSARILEGIGAGFIFPIGLSTIIRTLDPKNVPFGLILYVITAFGAGFAVGLPLAGYVSQFISWRWCFFLMIPFTFFFFLLYRVIGQETETKKELSFDFLGYVSFVTFIGTLLVVLTYGPMLSTNEGWRSPWILLGFLVAGVALIVTIFAETRHKNPILPLSLFKDPVFSVTCIAMFLLGMSVFASVATTIQYMIEALLYERFVSGKLAMIYGLGIGGFSVAASLLMKKVPTPVLTFLGLIILVYSYFLNHIFSWQTGPDQILLILFIRGMGVGLALGPATIDAMQHVPKELSAKGATILTFFRQVGGTYGGTLITILTIKRQIFHQAMYGEQTTKVLPGYQVTFQKLYQHYQTTFFNQGKGAEDFANAAIIRNIEVQSFVSAINDAMTAVAYVTGFVAILLALLGATNKIKEHRQKRENPSE